MTKNKIWKKRCSDLVIWLSRHPVIAAFLCGICATLTLPPFYLFPLVVPAYGGLYYLLTNATSTKQAAKIGFFWGWGFYITGLYWFVIALMTDPDKFAWLIPLALFALTAVIALYTTVFGLLSFWVSRLLGSQATKQPSNLATALLFASLFTLIEYARGHLFTGFPWNLGGYVFAASDASIQLASLTNIYGLTFITVFLGAICVAHKRAAIACWLTLALAISWGAWRAHTAPHEIVEGVKLRLVQGNINQQHKWDPTQQYRIIRTYLDLSAQEGSDSITHIIWPETALPYIFENNSTLAARLGATLRPNQKLITGAVRREGGNIYNSLVAIDAQGQVTSSYNKHKLVPFGEFLPLRRLIPDALETPVGMTDMAAGDGPQTLSLTDTPPFSPLICYEVIFPEMAVKTGTNPAWLLSITNDAWFGTSTAPYQHLASARMRAVEQGIPMVRVANSGITTVYDAYGREMVKIPLNNQGVIDTYLPKSRNGT